MTKIVCAPLLAACLFAGFGAATASAASDPPAADSIVMQVREFLVRGARPVATPGGAGAIQASLDSLRVPAAATAEDVMRALPTTYLRTNSRGETEVTLRGSESRQVALLLDGIPLTLAWDGRADVSLIPVLAPQGVTLVRGLGSLLHGPNTLGGVVEFTTHSPRAAIGRPYARLQGGVDQVGALGVAAAVTAPRRFSWGVLTARAGAGGRESPGVPRARGVEEGVPTEKHTRLNTDLRDRSGFVALRLERHDGAFASFAGAGFEAERGIAAQLGVDAPRFWRQPHVDRAVGILSGSTGRRAMPWGGRSELQISTGLDRGHSEIDAYASNAYDRVTAQEDGNAETWTTRATASQSLGNSADLRTSFSWADVRHEEILNGVSSEYRQRLWSVAGQASVRLPGTGPVRDFDLSLGTAFDAADTPLTGGKPSFEELERWGGRLGLSAHLGSGNTTLHASASQRARFPSLRELYSGALGSFQANPSLRPENLRALEAGFTATSALGVVQVAGFHHLLSDAVVRIRPPGGRFQRVNQEGVRSVGAELLASRGLGPIEVSGDLIAQDVKVRDPAAGLTRPENMPRFMGGLRAQLPFSTGWSVAAEARYTGEQFAFDPDSGNETQLPDTGRLNLEVLRQWRLVSSHGWFDTIEARTAVDNLTDAIQSDAYGLPQPGRRVRLELQAR